MKKLLFATVFASTALASSMGCNTDTLTGLHFGLGVSVLFDKYEADVDVATVVDDVNKKYKTITGKAENNITGDELSYVDNTPAINVVNWTGNAIADIATINLTLGGKNVATNASGILNTYPTAYVKRNTFKKRTTNCGGEVKLAYFHDFGNHLMVGVDLTGIIASKNKKTVKVDASTINPLDTGTCTRSDARACRQTCLLHIIANTRLSIA